MEKKRIEVWLDVSQWGVMAHTEERFLPDLGKEQRRYRVAVEVPKHWDQSERIEPAHVEEAHPERGE